jgi:AraC-like DNA-binding protein
MHFSDPESFEEFLAPIAGDVRIRPMTGSSFRANIDMRMLQKAGLFTIEADSFLAQKVPQKAFYGFSIPLDVPFTVSESGEDLAFGRANAHMLSPGKPFTFKCKTKCHTMACNFFVDQMQDYRERMLQEANSGIPLIEPQISLMSAAGSGLMRSVVRAWIALEPKGALVNEIALQELEDDLLASFLSLAEDQLAAPKQAALPCARVLRNMEDYICANLDTAITRDDLADKACVSIRSLSRAFDKKYGLGPMAFIRQRRLDACYIKLRGSERCATTVTEVAMTYGFEHMGKFAIAYKDSFGESPSASLQK